MLRAALTLTILFLSSSTLDGASAAEEEEDWVNGPVRWLMLPSEQKQARRIETKEELSAFIEDFWRRRQRPKSGESGSKRALFARRKEEADLLFNDEATIGSQTSRGRAYILLGPPSELIQEYRKSPEFRPVRINGTRQPETRQILEETWSWRPEDLSQDLQREMNEKRWRLELRIRFEVAHNRHILRDGEDLLRLAARAWLEEPR